MALDPYASCPCGSGKKFKWCCQPVHVDIDRAFAQEAEGQHEAALKIMDEVVARFPDNPEAWGRRAELLYQNDRVNDAEASLDKALEVSPSYPFGHLLRGMFRQNEGELAGAVLLYRKAAELYDPDARDFLAVTYSRIAESELKLNRPVAARAALRIALNCAPNEELQQVFSTVFGNESRLPAVARREYTFQSPSTAAAREAWDRALAAATGTRPSQAAQAFEQLVSENESDAAAWYNLGLARAWLGDNRRALEALDRYLGLETDEEKAEEAAGLGAVLRQGAGMDEEADYIDHAALFQIRNPEAFFGFLERWGRSEQRLIGVQVNQEQGIITGAILEKVTGLTAAHAAAQSPALGASLLVVGQLLRIWHTNLETLQKIQQEIRQALGPAVSEPSLERSPAGFGDLISEAVVIPIGITDEQEAKRRVTAGATRYFEEVWVNRPLRSLSGVSPLDAAGHATLRKKLRGAIRFLEDCANVGNADVYDFNRLRRKLGLAGGKSGGVADTQTGAASDPSAMSAAELAGLPTGDLADETLEQAYQAALKLDAPDLAGRFAESLVGRAARADRPDRFPWYSFLIQRALAEDQTERALEWVDQGEKADCEQNQGRRRNDYELRRAQIHARRGDASEAASLFQRLIDRAPDDLKFRGSAAEAMLAARQPAHALRFAEEGLSQARRRNDRDSEGYFQELAAVARKQGS